MSEKVIENNKVSVIGEVVSEFTFSHEVFGEGFYLVSLSVSRLSDQVDVIPLMVSERLLESRTTEAGPLRLSASSAPITAMRELKTALCFLSLSES